MSKVHFLQNKYSLHSLLSLQLEGEETVSVVSAGHLANKYNIVSYDHGHMQK